MFKVLGTDRKGVRKSEKWWAALALEHGGADDHGREKGAFWWKGRGRSQAMARTLSWREDMPDTH